ncbi:RNA binding motif-containing protein [Euroglyphus maynei]|uniref:RNA binding motif-containing protein n=1 Tax=Euroglyphus maynei TaxID=6958 RepID=A0A1Y3BMV8_EURMA|nr:RNA binding motif-containing protein [Euroglyphus maynei]
MSSDSGIDFMTATINLLTFYWIGIFQLVNAASTLHISIVTIVEKKTDDQSTKNESAAAEVNNNNATDEEKKDDAKNASTKSNDNVDELQVPKLFVGRLPSGTKESQLKELFSTYGQVTHCDIVGKYGFVHMKDKEEARVAMEKLNNHSFNGSTISVQVH